MAWEARALCARGRATDVRLHELLREGEGTCGERDDSRRDIWRRVREGPGARRKGAVFSGRGLCLGGRRRSQKTCQRRCRRGAACSSELPCGPQFEKRLGGRRGESDTGEDVIRRSGRLLLGVRFLHQGIRRIRRGVV